MDRKSILKRKPQKKSDDKVRGIFTHNKGNPPLHQWFREAKKCLIKDDRAKALGDNFQICYRQPKNLRSTVTHRRQPSTKEDDPGCKKCGKCSVSCPVLVEGSRFTSTNTKKCYPIRKKLNCDSSYLIYWQHAQNAGGSMWERAKRHSKKDTATINKR